MPDGDSVPVGALHGVGDKDCGFECTMVQAGPDPHLDGPPTMHLPHLAPCVFDLPFNAQLWAILSSWSCRSVADIFLPLHLQWGFLEQCYHM